MLACITMHTTDEWTFVLFALNRHTSSNNSNQFISNSLYIVLKNRVGGMPKFWRAFLRAPTMTLLYRSIHKKIAHARNPSSSFVNFVSTARCPSACPPQSKMYSHVATRRESSNLTRTALCLRFCRISYAYVYINVCMLCVVRIVRCGALHT